MAERRGSTFYQCEEYTAGKKTNTLSDREALLQVRVFWSAPGSLQATGFETFGKGAVSSTSVGSRCFVWLSFLHIAWSLLQTAKITLFHPAAVMLLQLYCCAQELVCCLQSLLSALSLGLAKAVISPCTPCLAFYLEHLHLLNRISR